jgi:hypothetical protein
MTQINRSITKVITNSLPKQQMGWWFQKHEAMNLRIKPAYDNSTIMVAVEPILSLVDAHTQIERYRFQTQTTFQFDSKFSKKSTFRLVYDLINTAIDDFNLLLQKVDSALTIHKEYSKPSYDEMVTQIEKAFEINSLSNVNLQPYWKVSQSDFLNNPSNDELIQKLPAIPEFKKFFAAKTFKQQALDKLMHGNADNEEEKIIQAAMEFYKNCFSQLQKINLFVLSDKQAQQLKEYLKQVFNVHFIVSNTATFELLDRVTTIKDEFRRDGKVRDIKFLRNPSLELNKKNGVHGRANSPDTTVFYASFDENVAIRETKPKQGERIIISTWRNTSLSPFVYFPIGLAPGIDTEEIDKITQVFESLRHTTNPLIVEFGECFFRFLGFEFIKDPVIVNSKKYEYLYSSFFADKILQVHDEGTPQFNFDAIVYPSVAWNHKHENIAIKEDSVKKLQLISAKEVEVLEVFYDRKLNLKDYPIRAKIIRISKRIENEIVVWSDD